MIYKILEYIKNIIRNKGKIQTEDKKVNLLSDYYHFLLNTLNYNPATLTETSRIIIDFLALEQERKERVIRTIIAQDIFIRTAVNEIINYTKRYELVFKHQDKELEKKINDNFKNIGLEDKIEELLFNYIVLGYFCAHVYIKENELKDIVSITALDGLQHIQLVNNTYHLQINDKIYTENEFMFDKNDRYYEFGVSPIGALLPYLLNHYLLLDTININIGRFGKPFVLLKTNKTFNENIRNDLINEIQKLRNPYILPAMVINEKEVNLEIEYPEDILKSFLDMIDYYIKIIYMAFGIGETLSVGKGGSYAKARVQEDMLQQFSLKILKTIRNQVLLKIIKPLIAFNNEEYFYNNNLGKVEIVLKEVSENDGNDNGDNE